MDEKWVEIYKIEDYKIGTSIWLEELLKDKKILYKNEVEEYWIGIRTPKYKNRLKMYVEQKNEEIVRKYIKEYNNSKSIIDKDIKEIKGIDYNEDENEINKYNKIRKIFKYFYLVSILILIIVFIINI